MGNKKTPLLQKLRDVGGTLYVFPSATEDIGLNLQSTTTGVAMSHFALLNIPELTINNCLKECSHSYIKAQDGNEALAMSLQNYAMNFETHLTNRDDYNYQKLETVSEKVFWHWAMHVGILNPADISNGSTGNQDVYIENAYNTDGDVAKQDDTVLKCFGAIDAGNQLSTEFGMFNETYVNIPTSWGAGPVYLKRSDSDNFKLGEKYAINSGDHLEGREDENAYYSYTQGQDYPFFDYVSHDDYEYQIDKINDGFEILKDLNQIQQVSRNRFNNDALLFDSYDDINIDSRNQLNVDQEFQFNAILLYYSVYDQDDLVKTAYATNLFGIIFLDGTKPVENNNGEKVFCIPPITKRKSTTKQFGNSYSFRVNLKTMSVYDNTDAIIQDNTTISGINAVEFSDAISNINRAIDIMNSNLTTTMKIQDQYAAIITYYDNFEDDLRDISTCLNAYLKGTHSSFIDTSIVYTNEIRTSEAADNIGNNQILIKTHKSELGPDNKVTYNEPVVTIKDSSVIAPILENSSMWTKYSYVVVDNMNPNRDVDILDPSNANKNFVKIINNTLDTAFNSSNGFNIKLKVHEGTYTAEETYNELYIDPESPIFVKNNRENLSCLLDQNNNINYVGIIPYLIAEIKRLRQAMIDAGIYQDLTPLNDEDFYGELNSIFNGTPNNSDNDPINANDNIIKLSNI